MIKGNYVRGKCIKRICRMCRKNFSVSSPRTKGQKASNLRQSNSRTCSPVCSRTFRNLTNKKKQEIIQNEKTKESSKRMVNKPKEY